MKYTFLIFIGITLIGGIFLSFPARASAECILYSDADDCPGTTPGREVLSDCAISAPKCVVTNRSAYCPFTNSDSDTYTTGDCCAYNYGAACNNGTGTILCSGTCSTAGYAECGSNLNCQGARVEDADSGTGSKCLSITSFENSDRINGKNLAYCNSIRYGIIDNKCTLLGPGDPEGLGTCTPPSPPVATFPLCESSLTCDGTTAGAACPSNPLMQTTKCLSNQPFGGDVINGKNLACCKAGQYDLIGDECTLVVDGRYTTSDCTIEGIAPSPAQVHSEICTISERIPWQVEFEDAASRSKDSEIIVATPLNCFVPSIFSGYSVADSSGWSEINYLEFCKTEGMNNYPGFTADCKSSQGIGFSDMSCCFIDPNPKESLCCPDGYFSCSADTCCKTTQSSETVNKIPCTAVTPTSPTSTPTECQVTTSPLEQLLFPGGNITISLYNESVSGLGTATITQMRFGSYGGNIASVPAPTAPDTEYTDTTSPYQAQVTANAYGATAIWAIADVDDNGDGIVDRSCPASGTTDTDIYVPHAISAKVFNDDGDGVQETGEIGTANAKVTLTPGNQYGFTIPTSQTLTGGRSDTAYFWRIPGNYTLTVTVPSGYTIRNSGSQVASMIINNLSQNTTYSFPVVPPPGGNTPTPTPQVCDNFGDTGAYCIADDGGPGTCNDDLNCSPVRYSISGKLFLDNYEDTQSTGDDKYTNSVAVTVKKGEETFAVTPSGGTYTADNLPAGDYTIKFSGLPEGWRFTYPNTPDNSLQVQVGPTCEYPITTSEASCRP